MTYDSRPDTLKHIRRVQDLLADVCIRLHGRAIRHDQSKVEDGIEKAAYDELGENLRTLTYGSPEYMAQFQHPVMKKAIAHHFANNSHHAEHYENGIAGMSLLDVTEMFMDWKAASERHDDGDIIESIEINIKRYGIDDQLASILRNTAREMGWEA